jgi:hypothetical protein
VTTETTQQSQEGTGVETSVPGVPSYDERVAQAFGNDEGLATETTEQSATEAPALDDAAKARAERRAAIQKALAEEAERVDSQARRKAESEALARAKALEEEKRRLEERVAKAVDPDELDEAGFFALAERMKVTPQKLGEWLSQRQTHPEVVAAQYAQKAVDPQIAELKKQIEEQNAKLSAFEQQEKVKQETAAAYQRGESMLSFATANAAQAPFAARFLEAHGAEQFLNMANAVYGSVPKGPGWEQHVLDTIEDNLSELAKIYAPRGASTQQTKAPPLKTNGAAKPMTTISNTLAASRATVVDEEADWAKLPFEERLKRAFE